jgi:PBP1b-binding outer membrane lipoprotein LpoB
MTKTKILTALAVLALLAGACTPTVKVEAPDKPIEINMNINIRHEILIKIEKEVEEMFEDEDLF